MQKFEVTGLIQNIKLKQPRSLGEKLNFESSYHVTKTPIRMFPKQTGTLQEQDDDDPGMIQKLVQDAALLKNTLFTDKCHILFIWTHQ